MRSICKLQIIFYSQQTGRYNKSFYPKSTVKLFMQFLSSLSYNTMKSLCHQDILRRVSRYQRGNQNPYIRKSKKDRQHNELLKDKRTDNTMGPKKKGQKDKQLFTNHYTKKTKDQATRTPLSTGGELRYSGRVSSYCSTRDIRHVTLIS